MREIERERAKTQEPSASAKEANEQKKITMNEKSYTHKCPAGFERQKQRSHIIHKYKIGCFIGFIATGKVIRKNA